MALHRHRHHGVPPVAAMKGRVGIHRRRPASALDIARRLIALAASSGTTDLLSPVNAFSPSTGFMPPPGSSSSIAPASMSQTPQICCPWSFLDPGKTQVMPVQTIPSFSSIVGDAVATENLPSLPIPEVRGDKIFVKISEALYDEQLLLFRTNLIGRLLLRKGSVPLRTDAIKASLDALWKPSKSWHLVPLGRGFFDIHFDSEADMKRIWNGGTCVLTNGIFRLSEWKPDFNPGEALSQSHSQVWIRISGLSQDYWHPRILMEIASGIGTPLQIDKATKDRQFGYYARILVDIDLSKDHPTSLMVERGNHVFPVAIDYETPLDKLKHAHARERPRSRSRKRGRRSDHPVCDPPHRQEYRVKTASVNVPLSVHQGLNNDHGETPLVSHHVETENRFAILASEPCEDHNTEPITVPLENIGEVVTNINVLAEHVSGPTDFIGSASVDPQAPKFCWGDLENEAPLGHSTESDSTFDSNFDNSWRLDEVNTNLDEERLMQSIPKIRPKNLKNKQDQTSSRHSARARMPVVKFPSLETLKIMELRKLQSIWNNQFADQDSFCRLRKVNVSKCTSLQNIFPASIAIGLQNLYELTVEGCDEVEEIIVGEERRETTPPLFVFPKVTSVEFRNMPKLSRFYPRMHTSKWPLLKNLYVLKCDKVKIFAAELPIFGEKHEMDYVIEQSLFLIDKDSFPNLEKLWLGVVEIWYGPSPPHFASKLKSIWFCYCPSLSKQAALVFLHKLVKLQNLDTLEVGWNDWEEIFVNEEGMNSGGEMEKIHAVGTLTLPRVKHLDIRAMEKLLHLGNYQNYQLAGPLFPNLDTLEVVRCSKLKSLESSAISFRNLTTLKVWRCIGLEYLTTYSVAKSLGQLTMLSLEDCDRMREIIVASNEDDHHTNCEIAFSRLQHLILDSLPGLQGFCSGNCIVKLPSSTKLYVYKCGIELKISSQGVLLSNSKPREEVDDDDGEKEKDNDHDTAQ